MPYETFFNLPSHKRNLITQLALEEFATRPYSRASITNIVDRAGIAKGSMYQYFKNKKDLFLYLIEIAGQAKLAYLSEKSDIDWGDFFTAYRDTMHYGIEFNIHHPLEHGLIGRISDLPFADEVIDKMKKTSQDFIVNLITMAQQKGQVRTDLPPDLIAYYVNTLSTELSTYLASRVNIPATPAALVEHSDKLMALDLNTIVDQLTDLIKNGIRHQQKQVNA